MGRIGHAVVCRCILCCNTAYLHANSSPGPDAQRGCSQSEYGDIYKVSLTYSEKTVSEVKVKYFDTLPPCISICVLKTGFLFAASEFGNHALYQFAVSPACSAIVMSLDSTVG